MGYHASGRVLSPTLAKTLSGRIHTVLLDMRKRRGEPELQATKSNGVDEDERKRKKSAKIKETASAPQVVQHWLFKSEPHKFSWDDLTSSPLSTAPWDGVRNYVARNHMLEMKVGDQGFFYHSSCKVPGIVGIVQVVKEGYPDHTSWDPASEGYDAKSTESKPRWFMVDVKSVEKLQRHITLPELKKHSSSALKDMQLFKQGRLSVQRVSKDEWDFIMEISRQEEEAADVEPPADSATNLPSKPKRKRKAQ